MKFDIERKSKVSKSFRVQSVLDRFDLSLGNTKEVFSGEFNLPDSWNVVVIVGGSGTGKTTIANELFDSDNCITEFNWTEDSILDNFSDKLKLDDILSTLSSVGFNTSHSYIKPFHVLSNGEKMRVNLARAILERDFIVFDEFTSVVDRPVAKIASLCVSKNIKKHKKKFVAVACHYDILEWLEPDWVFDTNEMKFFLNKKKSGESQKSIWNSRRQAEVLGSTLKSIII